MPRLRSSRYNLWVIAPVKRGYPDILFFQENNFLMLWGLIRSANKKIICISWLKKYLV